MTRLFPYTRKPETLELLAGVPAGTAAAADQLRQELDGLDTVDYDGWKAAKEAAGADACALDTFNTFGWGRFRGWQAAEAAGHDPVIGSTSDETLIAALLDAQGVSLPEGVTIADLEGVGWS